MKTSNLIKSRRGPARGSAALVLFLQLLWPSWPIDPAQFAQAQAISGRPSGGIDRAPANGDPESLESLRARIASQIAQPRFSRASWGIRIESLDTGNLVFEHDSQKYFNPASNAKIFTAALALDLLGPDYRIKTSLFANSKPDARGTIKGDLIVYGRGDPMISSAAAAEHSLSQIARALKDAGVRRIDGDLVGDESYFSGAPFGAGWGWDDLQWYYGAETSALSIDQNSIKLTVQPGARPGDDCRVTVEPPIPLVTIKNSAITAKGGSERTLTVYRPVAENLIYVSGQMAVGDSGFSGRVAVHKPANLFAHLLGQQLAREGIEIKGKTRSRDARTRESGHDASKWVELASIQSPPISQIVSETLKPSQNLYAELLLLQAGKFGAEHKLGDESLTTEARGLAELDGFLSRAGVKKDEVLLEEGAGLSRRDLVTPAGAVTLLAFAAKSRWARDFQGALPIAGVDGSLRNRMKGTRAEGNVHAKTGTLLYVNSLCGYVTSPAGERLVFSIMLNNYLPGDERPGSRDDIDQIVLMLANFTGRTGPLSDQKHP